MDVILQTKFTTITFTKMFLTTYFQSICSWFTNYHNANIGSGYALQWNWLYARANDNPAHWCIYVSLWFDMN